MLRRLEELRRATGTANCALPIKRRWRAWTPSCIAWRPAEAVAFAEAALSVHEKDFGPDHRWTMDSAWIATEALVTLGRGVEAEVLRGRYGLDRNG
jgi:hypothetical protein